MVEQKQKNHITWIRVFSIQHLATVFNVSIRKIISAQLNNQRMGVDVKGCKLIII